MEFVQTNVVGDAISGDAQRVLIALDAGLLFYYQREFLIHFIFDVERVHGPPLHVNCAFRIRGLVAFVQQLIKLQISSQR